MREFCKNEFDETRRSFLAGAAGLFLAGAQASSTSAIGDDGLDGTADVTLRIAPVQFEVAPGRTINTVGYNGAVPGPVVRFREGVAAKVDLFNDTGAPEWVHWHGFHSPVDVDGSEEEGSLMVPAHGRLRYRLMPTPSGSGMSTRTRCRCLI
jgi:FtsP/CotA-like multicopper oxidase with cupredoxin domain